MMLSFNSVRACVLPFVFALASCTESDGDTRNGGADTVTSGTTSSGPSEAVTDGTGDTGTGGTATGGTDTEDADTVTSGTTPSGGSGAVTDDPGRTGSGGSGETSGGTAATGDGGASTPAAGGSSAPGDSDGGSTGGSAILGDDFVGEVAVAVHDEVNTILVVTWDQLLSSDEVFLEFGFEDGSVMTSRAKSGETGARRDVVLGVPGDTEVTIRIVNRRGDIDYQSREYTGTTGAIPSGMPRPEVLAYDSTSASPDRFLFGAVEDSDGGCDNQSCFYHTTFWLYIMDRQGRIVWYYADPASNATSSFQRVARDGEYIWIEKRPFGAGSERGVLKMTLDWEYYEEIPVDGLSDCIDVTDDGSLLYDVTPSYELREMSRDGEIRDIWSCPEHFGNRFNCYSNTVNWDPASDTVMLSFPYSNTVVQIDRQTGDVVGQYGEAAGSYSFEPSPWAFEFQHFANITPDGTLLVSSHLPGNPETDEPVAYQHAFEEFTIDHENERLIQKWIYSEGPEWAMYKGMAIRLPNGNTLANYGTGGVIREITPDKETAFHVKFDVPTGDDFFNKMVGHNVLIDDLYALNGGGPE